MVQAYILTLWRPQALRFLKYGIDITKKRQGAPSTNPDPHPFFTFLTRCEDAMDHILQQASDCSSS